MKKILFSAAMLMVSSVAFAQADNVKKAKSAAGGEKFDEAIAAIEAAMQNPETKDQAETYNVAGMIYQKMSDKESTAQMLQQPFDAEKLYGGVLKMFQYWYKCDELAQLPDAKGKVKNKYRKPNSEIMKANRGNLINGGVDAFNKDNAAKALDYFGAYCDMASQPMFEKENYAETDTLLAQIGYYATMAASKEKNWAAVVKYADLGKKDKENGNYALQFKCEAYKQMKDDAKWMECLKQGLEEFPNDAFFSGNLIDYYCNQNKYDEALAYTDEMIAKNPQNEYFYFVKGYLYQQLKKYDEADEQYRKCISIKPDFAQAQAYAGQNLFAQAADIEQNASTDMNSPEYKADMERINELLKRAMPYFEKARELKPDDKALWLQNLKTIYYRLDPEKYKEIENL